MIPESLLRQLDNISPAWSKSLRDGISMNIYDNTFASWTAILVARRWIATYAAWWENCIIMETIGLKLTQVIAPNAKSFQ